MQLSRLDDPALNDPLQITHAHQRRYRHVRSAHLLRVPLAMMSLAAGIVGLIVNALDLTITFGPGGAALGTHPMTALLIIMLSVGLLHFRLARPTPIWRYWIGIGALCMVLMNLIRPDVIHDAFLSLAATADSRMGQDTSVILGVLFGSVVIRRTSRRLGLALVLLATTLIVFSFMGHSYDVHYLDGQMALTTLVALVPATFAVLTIYAHHPILRLMLASDENGTRTRTMVLIGFIVPWFGGLVLYLGYGVPERDYPVEAMVLSVVACSMIAISLYSGLMQERADRSRREVERQLAFAAVHDRLTGTLNRAGLNSVLKQRWDRFRSTSRAVGVVLMDLDHFKSVNDTYGHPAGDSLLAAVGAALSPILRSTDIIGRWGGEEFVIVLNSVDQPKLESIAERMRLAVKDLPRVISEQNDDTVVPFQVSASFGIGVFRPEDESEADALKRADIALYRAKAGGRDRVMFQESDDQPSAA